MIDIILTKETLMIAHLSPTQRKENGLQSFKNIILEVEKMMGR